MKKLIIVLMAAVLIAGCTGQDGGTTSGNGLAMTAFTNDAESQVSGRDIRLFLDVENQGESAVDANKTLIYLNGPIGTGLLQWQLMEGTQSATLERNLDPYDPLKDIPAGRATIKWRIRAPQMDSGQQKTDTFTARAYYDYQTRINGQIIAYSEAESVALKQKGETLGTASFTTTNGPLTITVRPIPDPVVITDVDETVTLELTVENTGGGTIYKNGLITSNTVGPSLAYDDLNRVGMTIDAGNLQANLAGTCTGAQELIGGKPTTLTCDIKVPRPSAKTAYPIKINLDYGYYIDMPMQLTAVGKS
jgi:hypothetical protein